ncbi:integrin beta-1-binding protein 2 [Dromiciops gliroides]|uniref:integrin beta-1-binding protein 2 n=1 Tax=Dromiciops gliroides TaxID=33562 RepID=UPI001CC6B2A4|nr:integrin beta-1-binding protein 2 [Dromiciops gliroides]XP_043830343.1 integrin beta-1-binding protein 2 [Dromiciops gliroides]
MSTLCFNQGCGQRFDPDANLPDGCRHHPGVPIFHDALKGWSCCHKRTTDFSEFLSIQGCTLGPHCAKKPLETPGTRSALQGPKHLDTIPKSAETLRRERPKEGLKLNLLPLNVSPALETALEQKELALENSGPGAGPTNTVVCPGSICQNPGCAVVFQGSESDASPCSFHPGGPRFHEGMKSWSCCGITTMDFSTFLAQPGCSLGRHVWQKPQLVSCRRDWHQTASVVVVTVYGQRPLPTLSWVKASQTKLHIHISFDGSRVFQEQMELWGVITVEQSFVSLMPSRAEISLSKANPGPWAQLEQPGQGMPAEKVGEDTEPEMMGKEPEEDSDDDLSWTEDEEEEAEGE